LNPPSETKDHTPDVQAPTPPSSATPTTEPKPESDCHQDQGRPSPEPAEPLWALLPEVEETKNPS
jgi:hypothetical protein